MAVCCAWMAGLREDGQSKVGGRGSGRRPDPCARAVTEDCRALDIRRLHEAQLLVRGRTLFSRWIRGGLVVASLQRVDRRRT